MSVFQSRTIDDAKRIVTQLAIGAHLTEWEGSASPFWQYATLTVGEHSFRVGVSSGGVISFNGDPFTPTKRVMCVTYKAARSSLAERIARNVIASRTIGQLAHAH
ncbi:hypothetical protein RP29_20075 [Acidovorax temperans]|uniref:Uncharacterized protein n=1 Tax=Acidovorax temperans TaxID=80878 RepID=A0A0D7K3B2_9BURK|nr:hypothetical protein [Acidovorax temperans]KJA08780.1 hypothetical protein RP29_20075 [Acidovorax temperans]